MEFNKNPRKKNAFLMSGMGIANQAVSNSLAFAYRTVFIHLMATEYLGINGLFTNIIQIFSLAELGIGSVVIFRLYQPIKEEDIAQTAALMRFYKMFYWTLAILVLVIGMSLMPCLPYIIKDFYELPKDLNLYFIYGMYVIQSATSYMFSYKQTLLDADQKGYINTGVMMVTSCIRYGVSIILLYLTRNYTLVLATGILLNILSSIAVNFYVSCKYVLIFKNKNKLKIDEIKNIFKDTSAMMCHRVGATVVTSTDNIILSTYVGTLAVGIYSNYYMIIQIIQNVMGSLFGSFTASIGNYLLSVSKEDAFQLYYRLHFACMWISAFCTSCLYVLMNPFIKIVWSGEKLLFSNSVVIILCLNFFLSFSRGANTAFSNAAGLFIYDKIRPLIEAVINLSVSIILAQKIGITGVFLGTIISNVFTTWWREPYLLYKRVFEQGMGRYFIKYLAWGGLTLVTSVVISGITSLLPENGIFLIARFLICGVGINGAYAFLFWKNENFQYYFHLIQELLKKKLKHL